MEFFRKIKGLIVLLLLPALLVLMGNAVFNWHVHQMADGTKIVHAHPFQKSGNPTQPTNHHHSSAEYTSIHQLTGFIFLVIQAVLMALLLGSLTQKLSVYQYRIKLSPQILLLPNRAPPFVG